MLKGIYQGLIRNISGQVVKTRPEHPESTLGTGQAEAKESIPIKIKAVGYEKTPTVKSIKDMTDIQYVGSGSQFKPEDFPKEYYMGDD